MKCPICNGRGEVWICDEFTGFDRGKYEFCTKCNGTGEVDSWCSKCSNTGWVYYCWGESEPCPHCEKGKKLRREYGYGFVDLI